MLPREDAGLTPNAREERPVLRVLIDVPLDTAALRRLEALPGVALQTSPPHERE